MPYSMKRLLTLPQRIIIRHRLAHIRDLEQMLAEAEPASDAAVFISAELRFECADVAAAADRLVDSGCPRQHVVASDIECLASSAAFVVGFLSVIIMIFSSAKPL